VQADRWAAIEALFDAALEQPEEERADFVERQAGADTELAKEVFELIGAFAESEAIEPAETPSPKTPPPGRDWVGRKIGTYLVDDEIGRGGMSRVFLAHRADDEFDRTVAIKLLQPGIFGDTLGARLRRERQILAKLDHPHIARLFDGDTTEDGLPYIVMEAIAGIPIDEYCDRHQLSIENRLVLFGKVCEAVSYAHRHLVVHLDIKPSNILVTADGTPKLLDFGIGKLLDPQIDEESKITITAFRPMTPKFASPEQLVKGDLTTASDVYSLGVLLYELVAERFGDRTSGSAMATLPSEETLRNPTRPSLAARQLSSDAIAVRQMPSAQGLARRLVGDLDTIVLHALRFDPAERYRTADDLRDDIDNHLNSRPISARPKSWIYTVRKLIRRKRGFVRAAAIAAAIAAVALVQVQRERREATNVRARAERIVTYVTGIFLDANAPSSNRRTTLLQSLQEGREGAELDFKNEPNLLIGVLELLATAAYRYGEYSEATLAYARIDELLQQQESVDPITLTENTLRYARALRRVPRVREAVQQASEGIERLETLPNPPAELLSKLYLELAESEQMGGNLQGALKSSKRAAAISEEAYGVNDALTLRALRDLWSTLTFLNRKEEAEQVLAKVRNSVGTEAPWNLALASRAKRVIEFERRLDEAQTTHGREAATTQVKMIQLANELNMAGQAPRGLQLLQEVLAIRLRTLGPTSPRVAATQSALGVSHFANGNIDESRSAFQRSLEIGRLEFPDGAWQMSGPMIGAACHLYRDGQTAAALELFDELLAILDREFQRRVHPRSEEIHVAAERIRNGQTPLPQDVDPNEFQTLSLVACMDTDRLAELWSNR